MYRSGNFCPPGASNGGAQLAPSVEQTTWRRVPPPPITSLHFLSVASLDSSSWTPSSMQLEFVIASVGYFVAKSYASQGKWYMLTQVR